MTPRRLYTVTITPKRHDFDVWARDEAEAARKAPMMVGVAGFMQDAGIAVRKREDVTPLSETAA